MVVARSITKFESCAYCGTDGVELTRDHVVPQAIWKDQPLPKHIVTVPACRPCQANWDKDATYFRNLLVAMGDFSDHPAISQLASGAVVRSIGRTRKDYLDITKGAVFDYRRTDTGIFVEPAIRIQVDFERFHRTPEKIIRGLLFHLSGSRLPDDYEVRIYPGNGFWSDVRYQGALDAMSQWQTMGDDVFAVRYVHDIRDPDYTLWLLMFYRSTAMLGFTCPRGIVQAAPGATASSPREVEATND